MVFLIISFCENRTQIPEERPELALGIRSDTTVKMVEHDAEQFNNHIVSFGQNADNRVDEETILYSVKQHISIKCLDVEVVERTLSVKMVRLEVHSYSYYYAIIQFLFLISKLGL